MSDCIFCKIISGDLPCDKVFENEEVIAFKDINPRAKTHLLIVPKKHIATIDHLNEIEGDEKLIGEMVLIARNLAREKNLPGYHLQFNVGKEGGQIVFHVHLHLMSNS